MIKIIAVGKKHDAQLKGAIESYEKRLRKPFDVSWVLLQYSAQSGDQARQEESGRIMDQLSPNDFVVLLDERGELLDSLKFSAMLKAQSNTVVIIGGAYGVSDGLRQRADMLVSLSNMVFPHQLVRLIIAEQIYRAQAISEGHPYHHV